MTEEITQVLPVIESNKPIGNQHELANQGALDRVNELMSGKQDLVPLATYMKEIAGKPRGVQGGNADLNSHFEEFIVKDKGEIQVWGLADLQEKLASQGLNTEILGVSSIGNPNQKVTAMVQGVNQDNPQSGYERPIVAEGPHMILAPYSTDSEGNLHFFRTIQYRTGEAVIDTPRGFADTQSLESGQQLYDVEGAGSRVEGNMKRIIGEEAGKKLLDIKRIVYLGAPRVNSSFVTSKSALFGVEVDYDSFTQSNKVVSEEEFQRRKEQLQHEGLMGVVIDMTADQYANYKRDSDIARDMAADAPSDIIAIDWLSNQLQTATQVMSERQNTLKTFTDVFKEFKKADPEAYKQAWMKVTSDLHMSNSSDPVPSGE